MRPSAPLPDFPAGAGRDTPAALRQRGFSLRPCTAADLGFLRDLYHLLRADELAQVPWPAAQKAAFLDSQFALQHKHYLTHYSAADFLVIEAEGQPAGRLYLSRQAPEYLIVDISLLPPWRNSGVGSALIRHAQALAAHEGATLNLHVEQRNHAARRLYERLGFVATMEEGAHIGMRWPDIAGLMTV